jgi:hypothetical protein
MDVFAASFVLKVERGSIPCDRIGLEQWANTNALGHLTVARLGGTTAGQARFPRRVL